MSIVTKVINCNNSTPQNHRDALRLNEAIFDNEISISPNMHQNFKPSVWVFIYELTPTSEILVGKADLHFKTSFVGNVEIKKCKISNLGILPFKQGNNYGSALLNKCVDVCNAEHCDYVYLDCKPTKGLKAFYKKNNFTLIEQSPVCTHLQQSTSKITMAKPLSTKCLNTPNLINYDIKQEKHNSLKKSPK